ncbi:hypothetical protein TIFTF001_043006 [Ficus carica]|uniref:Uncharacterized protein n=1 Tax=Ficus carica TaxID=3494 RepID=A0AA87Z1H1_FICCA|nr:hypothetical protein TIFTF001_043004 [Ficus carica]GMN20130.1 hypothetical protein TIFTF001_043006 [Ficus carica]
MTCPFLVMAGHMCRVMLALASQEPRWWPAMWSLCGETWLVLASQLSVLDLLCDDGLNGNMEEDIVHEAHVAFSVEGLGTVGTETPVHSPQRPNRTLSYGFSPSPKAAGRLKLSRKFNSSLDDFEFEMDAQMQDVDLPLDGNPLKFSSDIMDSLSGPKWRSFALRETRQHDGYSSKKNNYIGYHNEDEWDDRTSFQYQSFLDEREPALSWNTWQTRNDDNAADDLIYRDYNMTDFSFDGPHVPIRTTGKVTDKFDISESTFSFSKHETSEYDFDFLNSNRARFHVDTMVDRHPTEEKKLDFNRVTSKPDRYSLMTEDGRDNSSLQSEESCSSSAGNRYFTIKLNIKTGWEKRTGQWFQRLWCHTS